MKRNSSSIKKKIVWTLGIILPIVVWITGNYFFGDRIPSVGAVINSIIADYEADKVYLKLLKVTAFLTLKGLLVSLFISYTLVIITALLPLFEFFITPSIVILKATPVFAFIPIIVGFLSLSELSVITTSVIISFFPLVISGIDGLKRVPERLIELSEVYNANRIDLYKYVLRGYINESFLSGLKIGAPLSLIGVIVGQAFITGDGLGSYIASNIESNSIIARFNAIIISSILGAFFYSIAYTIHYIYERRLFISK